MIRLYLSRAICTLSNAFLTHRQTPGKPARGFVAVGVMFAFYNGNALLRRSKSIFLYPLIVLTMIVFSASAQNASTQPTSTQVESVQAEPIQPPPVQASDRLNIIVLMADDLIARMTGFAGHPFIKTPHLDQLAAEGIYFSRCYTPTPQCAPSRASFLTGQYPHTNSVMTAGEMIKPESETFSARLAANGYACAIVGKWDLPYHNAARPGYGFTDYTATCGEPWSWQDCDVWVQGQKSKADKFLTDWIADRAIEYLDRPHDRPFFLWVSFQAPHSLSGYPPGTEELYPPESVDLPRTMKMGKQLLPPQLRNSPTAKDFKKLNEQQLREARSKYDAMVTHLDANIGRILQRVHALKLRDNTLVIFASDNGLALGGHELYGEGPAFYEELIRSPLLIQYPKFAPLSGVKIDKVVSMIDLAPTILELAKVPIPMAMQGRSLLSLIRRPDTQRHTNERFLEYHALGDYKCDVRGIVTDKYKLIDYLGGTGQFYDLKRDPDEIRNAIKDAEYEVVVKVLRMRLDLWRKMTKDPLMQK